MDYKKKYKEALENLKKIRNANENNKELADFIEYNYPELKESEDERIRKLLISLVEGWKKKAQDFRSFQILWTSNEEECDAILAWLEKKGSIGKTNEKLRQYREYLIKETERWHKREEDETLSKIGRQDCIGHANAYISARSEFENLFNYDSWPEKKGEQKSTNKIEPKFKVGDWIISSEGTLRHIVTVDKTGYETDEGWLTYDIYEKDFHLWTIQDTKDGDVLCIHSSESDSDCVFLYQNTYEIESNRNVAVAYCCIDMYENKIEFGIQGPDCIDVRNVKPATKEQRDILFSKMKEAGYEWDAEKKELKKIEQNPAWSEEDEEILNTIIAEGDLKPSEIQWLKSIKERMKGGNQ